MSGERRGSSSVESPYTDPGSPSRTRARACTSVGTSTVDPQQQQQRSSDDPRAHRAQSPRTSSVQEENVRRRSGEDIEGWSNIEHREVGGHHRYSISMVEGGNRPSLSASISDRRRAAATAASPQGTNTADTTNDPQQRGAGARRASGVFEDVDLGEDVAAGNDDLEVIERSEAKGPAKYTGVAYK